MFRICNHGVKEVLDSQLGKIPPGTDIYWLTYSFDPDWNLLEKWSGPSLACYLRVVCCYPGQRVQMRKRDLKRFRHISRFDIGGLKPTNEYGLLHGKLIVAVNKEEKYYRAILGSFNLAVNSLSANCETVAWTEAVDTVEGLLDSAVKLWTAASHIDPADCVDALLGDEGTFAEDGAEGEPTEDPTPISGIPELDDAPARTGSRSVRKATAPSQQDQQQYRPVEAKLLKIALDNMLQDWPQGHPARSWQYDQYVELLERSRTSRNRAILYLPVGLGKTFIALRWLAEHLPTSNWGYSKKNDVPRVIFIAPNQWVQESVLNDVRKVADAALEVLESDQAIGDHFSAFLDETGDHEEALFGLFTEIIRVVRPSSLSDELRRKKPCAVVVDECHNWNPEAGKKGLPESSWQYTGV